ncbi:hypothetical protein QOT17_012749 [Balamuthia mandrillaris]
MEAKQEEEVAPKPPRYEARFAALADFDFVEGGKMKVLDAENIDSATLDLQKEAELTRNAITNNNILIAACDNEPVGYIWFVISDQTPFGLGTYGPWTNKLAWISFSYVSEAWRRKGVGTFLYQQVEAYCRKEGIKEVQLDVYLCNSRSLSFHESMGYTPYLQIYSKTVLPALSSSQLPVNKQNT